MTSDLGFNNNMLCPKQRRFTLGEVEFPCQEPTDWRYLPYVRAKFQGISPQNMALYGTNVPPFQVPENSIDWLNSHDLTGDESKL